MLLLGARLLELLQTAAVAAAGTAYTLRTPRAGERGMGEGGSLALLGRFPVARLSLALFTVYQPLKTSCGCGCSAVVQCNWPDKAPNVYWRGQSRSTARLPLRDGRATVSLVFGAYVLSRDSKTVATDGRTDGQDRRDPKTDSRENQGLRPRPVWSSSPVLALPHNGCVVHFFAGSS